MPRPAKYAGNARRTVSLRLPIELVAAFGEISPQLPGDSAQAKLTTLLERAIARARDVDLPIGEAGYAITQPPLTRGIELVCRVSDPAEAQLINELAQLFELSRAT